MIPSISPGNVRGLADKIIGLGKEVVGTVIDDDRIRESGTTQQEAGTERLKAVREEAKAKAKEASARASELRQQSSQHAKERVS
ncbi:MAG: hypothetical protein ACYCO3_05175 [Mycobacteriales bacterium]